MLNITAYFPFFRLFSFGWFTQIQVLFSNKGSEITESRIFSDKKYETIVIVRGRIFLMYFCKM